MRTLKYIPSFLICLFIPLAVGGLSGFFTSSAISTWYVTLNKPSFNPPNFIFAPVWTTLFTLMGISLFMIWKSAKGYRRNNALIIFSVQMVLNFMWSFLFFNFESPGLALMEIVMLWTSILMMIIYFGRINRIAAALQVPYLLWVSFASVLNSAIWYLNK